MLRWSKYKAVAKTDARCMNPFSGITLFETQNADQTRLRRHAGVHRFAPDRRRFASGMIDREATPIMAFGHLRYS